MIAIQARSSSVRFPEKVLTAFQGTPIIERIYRNCEALGLPVWVLTSQESSDDVLTAFLQSKGIAVFRGSLNNVLDRFIKFGIYIEADSLVRISGDSPLIHPAVISQALRMGRESTNADIITNVFPRTFPKGQSVELIRITTLLKLQQYSLNQHNQEHLTSYIYENPTRFKIANFQSETNLSNLNLCVDTPEDLFSLESKLKRLNLSSDFCRISWPELALLLQNDRG